MIATSGAKLLDDDALDALRTRLVRRASVLTPNIPEAELLLGHAIVDAAAADAALDALRALGAQGVLLKGGHLDEGDTVIDRYADPDTIAEELNAARRLFADRGWPVIDVTRRSIEETAAELMNLLGMRRDKG